MNRPTRLALVLICASAAALPACTGGGTRTKQRADDPYAQLDERARRGRELFAQAEAAQNRGDADRAIALYRDAVRNAPDLAEAWNNLGILLMERMDYAGAAEAFRVAMDLRPTDPRPAENLGLAYLDAGWGVEALRYYEMALERDPNRRESLRGAIKATHLLNLADQKALDRVRRALLIENDPDWRMIAERERVRIEHRLESERSLAR